ncbi:class I SAM-dependent methyltransferase [Pedobacter aquatilis]|uniref:class I SAM-dependent methyltransferase n=1 Tax=Pedobacter aquatilis TaxID=351343 RepID=UPI002930E1BC|nr:methyltransferase domain-containing protein [Pedobacter aquatilis]
MEYTGLQQVNNADKAHLGGNILEGDPFTFSPKVWNYMIKRFALKSVMDLGSGLGYSARYFHQAGLEVIAVDGMRENIEKAVFPTIEHDLAKGAIHCKVDLVHCQEVVEHIAEEFLPNLLSSLTCGKLILMTNALPGQEGYHHVNEQECAYWNEHLAEYDCHVLHEDTARIRKLAASEGAHYLAQTGTIYANRKKI